MVLKIRILTANKRKSKTFVYKGSKLKTFRTNLTLIIKDMVNNYTHPSDPLQILPF